MAEDKANINVDYSKFVEGVGVVFGGVMEILQSLDPAVAEMVFSAATKMEESVTKSTPAEKEMPAEEPAKNYTLEDVRKVLSEKSGEGHTNEVRKLLKEYGSSKLSGIDPDKYASLIEAAKKIGGEDG